MPPWRDAESGEERPRERDGKEKTGGGGGGEREREGERAREGKPAVLEPRPCAVSSIF